MYPQCIPWVSAPLPPVLARRTESEIGLQCVGIMGARGGKGRWQWRSWSWVVVRVPASVEQGTECDLVPLNTVLTNDGPLTRSNQLLQQIGHHQHCRSASDNETSIRCDAILCQCGKMMKGTMKSVV